MLIQLARCKFYTVGPLHTAMSAILYWYTPVRSKSLVGATLHSHRGIETNKVNRFRIGSKFGWYGKANQKSGRLANVLFHSYMNKTGRSTFRTCWASTAHACAFDLLSPSISEKLSFPEEVPVFFIFRHKLLNFNLTEPQTLFLKLYYLCLFLISLTINFLSFGVNVVNGDFLHACLHFWQNYKSYKYYFLDV